MRLPSVLLVVVALQALPGSSGRLINTPAPAPPLGLDSTSLHFTTTPTSEAATPSDSGQQNRDGKARAASTSFISRGLDGLAAEARHRQFGPAELARLFRSAGCQNDEIVLLCKDVNETIVIENANFYSLPALALNCSHGPLGPLESAANPHIRDTFFPELLGLPRMSRDLRLALNSRCSGLGRGEECSFNLILDHPLARQWGAGLIDIFYRCAPSQRTHRICDNEIRVSSDDPAGESQFLMSPVYPKYYKAGRKCKWQLRAEPGQRIQLRFLDISLRERQSESDPECSDSVSVSERGKTLMRMCGEATEDIMLLSEGHTLEVKMDIRSKTVYPRRGILAEFWPLGCATQREPPEGYLQYRNDTHATYSCSIGYVFLPSLDKTQTVICKDKTWDRPVGNCYSIDFLRNYGNETIVNLLENKTRLGLLSSPGHRNLYYPNDQAGPGDLSQHTFSSGNPLLHQNHSGDWFSDTVLPVVIGGVLVILSLFAVLVLLLVRRHLQLEDSMITVGGHYSMDEDRSALTPGSVRRGQVMHVQHQPLTLGSTPSGSSPVLHLDVGRQLQQLQQRERELHCHFGSGGGVGAPTPAQIAAAATTPTTSITTFRDEQLFSC